MVEEPKAKCGDDFISEREAYKMVMWEGSKSYLTRHVSKDNKDRVFKPYKDLCARIAGVILEYNPLFLFSHSLACTSLEMSHSLQFFKNNLPVLTDFSKDNKRLIQFLETLAFNAIKKQKVSSSFF